jgi:predicted glycoside hydrolase/deacetylase ChbG (UPF0249 family)
MPNMPYSKEALSFARNNPQFCYGLHLTFCEERPSKPVSDPTLIPHLVDKNGMFFLGKKAQLHALFSLYPLEELAVEIEAQIRLVSNYCTISYVDSHWHLHKYKPFREALAQVLPKYGIECVRRTQNVFFGNGITHPTRMFSQAWGKHIQRQFLTSSHFFMPTGDDGINWPVQILGLSNHESMEVGIHPGTLDTWRRIEVESMVSFYSSLDEGGMKSLSWKQFSTESHKSQ